jgi:hypothetical protein
MSQFCFHIPVHFKKQPGVLAPLKEKEEKKCIIKNVMISGFTIFYTTSENSRVFTPAAQTGSGKRPPDADLTIIITILLALAFNQIEFKQIC